MKFEENKDLESLEKVKELMLKLCEEIEFHNRKYYEEDAPTISDYEYDILYRKLEDLENRYPELILENSPTKKIGGKSSSKFSPVEHLVPMQSLHDSFSYDELKEFIKRVESKLGDNVTYVVEPKIDGLSVSLEYKDGYLFRGSTRGNGLVGEDVTENIKAIRSVPLKLKEEIPFLEIRGEVYISEENFLNLVNGQIENGEKNIFKNPRNAAAGSLRQKDPNITRKRNLDILIFNVQKIIGKNLTEHKESIDYLRYLGFSTVPSCEICKSTDEIIREIKKIDNLRKSYPFSLDGAVLKVNSFENRNILGTTAKFPRWAEAYKYPAQKKETKLLDIKVNVGRTGIITPIAVFEPINLAGTTVNKATLHNEDFIKEKGIKINDIIVVRKAGEIIPEVVCIKNHTKDSIDFSMPKFCPVCKSLLIKEEGEVATRCQDINCPAQLLGNIVHFVSRNAMDIENLGPALIKELINKKLIKNVDDIYKLREQELMTLSKVNRKSAFKLVDAINNSKKAKLSNLIYALGIRNVGLETSRVLEQNFKNLKDLQTADYENFKDIPGFGKVVSESIINYFKIPQNQKLIENLIKIGINPESRFYLRDKKSIGKFENVNFVITGTLEKYTREEITQLILSLGGKVLNGISKKVNYLLVGENPGSKLEKAKNQGIKVITEEEFLSMVK